MPIAQSGAAEAAAVQAAVQAPLLPVLDGEANGGSSNQEPFAGGSAVPSDVATISSNNSPPANLDMGVGAVPASTIMANVEAVKHELQSTMTHMQSELVGRLNGIERRFAALEEAKNSLRLFPEGLEGGPTAESMMNRSYLVMPQFVDENGRKLARFHFDVGGFSPEDVSIKTADNKIVVTAKHEDKRESSAKHEDHGESSAKDEDKGEDHHAIAEFRRVVPIPQGMHFEQMKSRPTPNGVLTIEAPFEPPAIQQAQVVEIAISHEPPRKRKLSP